MVVLTLSVLGWARPAEAIFQLTGDGSVGTAALRISLAEAPTGGRWSASAQLEGAATKVALLYWLPGNLTEVALDEATVLRNLDERTAPTLRILSAADPCGPTPPAERRQLLVDPLALIPGNFTVERLTATGPAELAARLGQSGLTLDQDALRRAGQHATSGGSLVLLVGPGPGGKAGLWTPPVSFTFAGPANELPLGVAASSARVGRTLRVTTFTSALGPAALVPKDAKVVDLPSGFNLPEVAEAESADLVRRLGDQLARRERTPIIVRVATTKEIAAPGRPMVAVARYDLQLGRRAERTHLTLGPDPTVLAFRAEWPLRQIFRGPIGCDLRDRYRLAAMLQIQADLRTFATVTGQALQDVTRTSEARGFGAP